MTAFVLSLRLSETRIRCGRRVRGAHLCIKIREQVRFGGTGGVRVERGGARLSVSGGERRAARRAHGTSVSGGWAPRGSEPSDVAPRWAGVFAGKTSRVFEITMNGNYWGF
ncbi:hypothetical protein GUJ93_ZPchr0003g17900 [Zizania palustris]|uniref:Uncharacterized protein n=1 Tax=Zizania palustris TaxID=103762 RepID=A0A8J5SVP9_ZIZPA|nr:hypothetical protein GUJ93_ZPchr0003g17900 [Zizania palustris]